MHRMEEEAPEVGWNYERAELEYLKFIFWKDILHFQRESNMSTFLLVFYSTLTSQIF